ncbi:MAG: cysteine--tRNA ligase [Thaumarchaeota archaeon]|nr:MAG: cysteine--tRNA ligase [Nitrososphaerota archaeon]
MLRLYNTMTRTVEEFKPLRGNRVYMYVCGPTVYDYSHIGHARTYIAYDVLARYLREKGYSVFYLMNITDVDDKIIRRAREHGVNPIDLAREYERYFMEDMETLGIQSVNLYARASEYIDEIVDLIKVLMDKGFAYETETGVYFDTSRFKDYGKLSHRRPEELSVHRIEPDPTKRNPQDFALWKKRDRDEMGWDSPWGYGRPGWHIEDTAIILTHFGSQIDIHGGAIELTFPHHEAEIAQAEAATGKKPFVRYWCHTGLLTVGGEKMSKSLGNYILVRDIVKEHDPEALRLMFLLSHYRSPIDFKWRSLESSESSLNSLYNMVERLRAVETDEDLSEEERKLEEYYENFKRKFYGYLDDDLDTPRAMAELFKLASTINKFLDTRERLNALLKLKLLSEIERMGRIFGILKKRPVIEMGLLERVLEILIDVRGELRMRREFELADRIRDRLREIGIILEDIGYQTRWRLRR